MATPRFSRQSKSYYSVNANSHYGPTWHGEGRPSKPKTFILTKSINRVHTLEQLTKVVNAWAEDNEVSTAMVNINLPRGWSGPYLSLAVQETQEEFEDRLATWKSMRAKYDAHVKDFKKKRAAAEKARAAEAAAQKSGDNYVVVRMTVSEYNKLKSLS